MVAEITINITSLQQLKEAIPNAFRVINSSTDNSITYDIILRLIKTTSKGTTMCTYIVLFYIVGDSKIRLRGSRYVTSVAHKVIFKLS